jgi:hypothetical protein
MTVARELRDLAKAIENHTLQSHAVGPAMPIVRLCVDHLNLLARLHELNAAPPGQHTSNPPGYGD